MRYDDAPLFLWGLVAGRRGGFSRRWTLPIALINAALGWLIVTAALAPA